LDIACGTGELCFELAALKRCQVVGLDLSQRMIEFARKRNRYDTVRFLHGDGADLANLEPQIFDFATILFLLHEIPRQIQIAVVNEALRVARKTIIIDSLAPLPKNLHGIALRIVEGIGGPQHYRSFANYLAAGGISGILAKVDISVTVVQRSVFWYGCRDMAVLESQM